jgi:hypothetical protein
MSGGSDVAKRLKAEEIHAQIPAAKRRAARERGQGLRATSARFDRKGGRIVLELTNGFLVGIPVSALVDIADASGSKLAEVRVSPAGSALYFDALDAHYSVSALVLAMTAREVGRAGGKSRSAAKRRAARANGAKGGRPRKVRVAA